MRPSKRRIAAREREKLKKQRIDPDALLADGSDTSCYAPSDSPTSDSEQDPKENLDSTQTHHALLGVLESDSIDLSESDGEIMLEMDEEVDENDWDPSFPPDFYPIFTQTIHSFKEAEDSLRASYTGGSRRTFFRKQAAARELERNAKSCHDIRSFFLKKATDQPAVGTSESEPKCAEDDTDATGLLPALSCNSNIDTQDTLKRVVEGCQSNDEFDVHQDLPSYQDTAAQDPDPVPETDYNAPELERFTEILAIEPALEPAFEAEAALDENEKSKNQQADVSFNKAPKNERTAPHLGTSVWKRLQLLRKRLGSLRENFEKQVRSGKKKVDPRDLSDVHTLLDYCALAESICKEGHSNAETAASLQIARTKVSSVGADGDVVTKGAWFARTLRSKATHVRNCGELPERRQGKGGVHRSLLDEEEVAKAVKAFIAGLPVGKVTPFKLMREVNDTILPSLPTPKSKISENTAKKWLLRLGYRRDTYRKGIYMDGHERADVVEYRNIFLDRLHALEPQIQKYTDKECQPIPLETPAGVKPIIPAFHDECCFHANDQAEHCWITEGQTLLRQKGRGRLIHVSDIVIEPGPFGRLKLSDKQIKQQKSLPEAEQLPAWDARKIIYPGKGRDAYWDMPQLIEQVKLAIKIFEVMFPGAIMLLFFDQSSAHNAYASNSLNARKMNVGPGGKQPIMHDTVIPKDNPNPALRGQHQTMVLPNTDPVNPGGPKGMEIVLKERGLWESLVSANAGKKPLGRCKACRATAVEREKMLAQAQAVMESDPDLFGSIDNAIEVTQTESLEALSPERESNRFCCMENCLAHEADFKAEKPLLQLVVEEAGHMCILLPKFHCELNPIELYWGYAKKKFRAQCNGSFTLAKTLVPQCLDDCAVITIRRFFQKVWRYMDAYRNGLTGIMAEHAVKKFTSHRKITKQIMMEVAMLIS